MNALISGLAGAGGAANTTGGFYNDALNKLISAYGSPAADTFSGEEVAALKPGFQDQQQGRMAQLNASGIANSGAAKASLSDLYGRQSAAEAGQIGPLYSQALGQYGSLVSQEPGAQTQSYQEAINNFYNELNQAAADYTGGAANPGGGSTQPSYNSNPYTSSTDETASSYPGSGGGWGP